MKNAVRYLLGCDIQDGLICPELLRGTLRLLKAVPVLLFFIFEETSMKAKKILAMMALAGLGTVALAQSGPIRIGVVTPLTGTYAGIGGFFSLCVVPLKPHSRCGRLGWAGGCR